MRMPWPAAVGGVLVVALGAAGLIRGAVPQSSSTGPSGPVVHGPPVVVSNAYVRPPVPPNTSAAAYFTVDNETGQADRLVSVTSGASEMAMLHTAGMTTSGPLVIPAHGRVQLSTGHGHVMLMHVFGTLKPGQTVSLQLTFEHAGTVSVAARVIAVGAPDPTGGSR